MQDSDGRWFTFKLSLSSMVIIEKRSIPEHLRSLECLDAATQLGSIVKELEDIGEVAIYRLNIMYFSFIFFSVSKFATTSSW